MRLPPILLSILAALLLFSPAVRSAALAKASAEDASGTTEEARIPSEAGVTLAATLRLPKGKGRYPVLILQTGSGPHLRGAYITLQRRLVDAGIATIDFDKRGVGESTGTFTDTMQDMEADLAATIAWLRKRDDIDGNRIALLGHSQGAAAAPIVADRDGKLAAVVFLAGPVGDRGTMFLDGMRNQLIEGGRTPEAADQVIGATRNWMEARLRGAKADETGPLRGAVVNAFARAGFPPEGAEGATKVLDSDQLLSMYETAPGPALARLRIPVLAIFAGRDELGISALPAIVALEENPKAMVVQIPGAGHNFAYRAAGAPPRVNPPGGRWLFPEALIARWLIDWLLHDGPPQP